MESDVYRSHGDSSFGMTQNNFFHSTVCPSKSFSVSEGIKEAEAKRKPTTNNPSFQAVALQPKNMIQNKSCVEYVVWTDKKDTRWMGDKESAELR